jgi:hypothetical protein
MPSADVDAGVLLGFVPLIISTAQFEPQSAFDQGSRYSEPAPTVTMWLGVPTYFAANLHAAHARRALTDELLDTGLTSTQQRTLALCLRVTARFLVDWALAAGLDNIIAAATTGSPIRSCSVCWPPPSPSSSAPCSAS